MRSCVLLTLIALLSGCSGDVSKQSQQQNPPATTQSVQANSGESSMLKTGMATSKATAIMKSNGRATDQMAISLPHSAYTMDDGRVVVLIGDPALNSIMLIENPDAPKSERIEQILQELEL